MKFVACILYLFAVLVLVFAGSDAGNFIPKAFYTLDSNGHKSNLHAVSPNTVHYLSRLRRQVVSSSSSSSAVTANDGVTHFTSQLLDAHTPEVSFSSRFGGSDDVRTTGHVVQTTGVIDENGKAYYKTHEGHF